MTGGAMQGGAIERGAMRRGLDRALVLVVLCVTNASGSVGERVRIELADGNVIEGRAYDLGAEKLEVHGALGKVKILKRDVVRWSFRHEDGVVPVSVLVLKSGQEIPGSVDFDAGEWRVELDVGTARYREADVLRVIQPSGWCSDGAFTPRGTFDVRVEEAIERVRGEDSKRRAAGERYLGRAGYFALTRIEAAREQADPGDRLARLALSERLKISVPDGLIEAYPEFLETIMSGSEERRQAMLREIFLDRGDELNPLFSVLILDPAQPASVRGLALDVLQRSHSIENLVEAYGRAVGRAQLAVAIALGDAGIYIGIPTLIEALDVNDSDVYILAGEKLSEYTGESYGFDPTQADLRRTAKARWTGWWREHQDRIKRTLAFRLRHDGAKKPPERAKAEELWRQGNRVWEDRKYDVAEEFFKRATQLDPTYILPLVSLGIMTYRDRSEFEAAIQWFRQALRRGLVPDDEDGLRLAYYHLGRIYQLSFDFQMARNSFLRAIEIDPDYADAWYHLGTSFYEEALRLTRGTIDERRELFEGASAAFEKGLERLREYREGLVMLTHESLPIGSDLPFSRRDYNRSLLDLRERLQDVEASFAHRVALTRLALGDREGALTWATEAAESRHPQADYHRLRAQILSALGRDADALTELEKARALDPDKPRRE